jgi:peptide/nickel transport system substrate-binding protein
MYTPVDKLPDSVKKLFEYNPTEAKRLLAEAGYPNGFNTEILCLQTDVDLLSAIKADWQKIGVNLTLDVKEYAAHQATYFAKKHKEMVAWVDIPYLPFKLTRLTPGSTVNLSMVDDPVINAARDKMDALYPQNTKEQRLVMKDLAVYILEQCYYIGLPGPYYYAFWQPWVKNYSGEYSVGYYGDGNFLQYIWYDQDLKKEMTGNK